MSNNQNTPYPEHWRDERNEEFYNMKQSQPPEKSFEVIGKVVAPIILILLCIIIILAMLRLIVWLAGGLA